MGSIKTWRPSPAIVIAIAALIAALAGTAIAGTSAGTSALNRSKVKKIVTKQIDARAPGLSVAHANTAGNADKLGGEEGSAFRTHSASAEVRDDQLQLDVTDQTVVSTTIALPSTRTVTAVASIEGFGANAGDVTNCNLEIAGVDGVRQTIVFPTANGELVWPLTQARTLGPGTHTVRVECNHLAGDDTGLDDRSLVVIATG
jgi:hypothetical protein